MPELAQIVIFLSQQANNIKNLARGNYHRSAKTQQAYSKPKNYRPISLLCVPFKVLERLLLARLDPIVDPQLPNQQAGFRCGRSTVHQIVSLNWTSKKALKNGKRRVLSWWISLLPTTPSGTGA